MCSETNSSHEGGIGSGCKPSSNRTLTTGRGRSVARTKASRTPRLPKEIHTSIGSIPVTECDKLTEEKGAFGLFDFQSRVIKIDSGASPELKMQTLFHELTHAALWDSGCTNNLTEKQEESVCDALGTFLAAMVQHGSLRFVTTRKK
jgi:Zn-dependent peptidase ImmA (M78 family)